MVRSVVKDRISDNNIDDKDNLTTIKKDKILRKWWNHHYFYCLLPWLPEYHAYHHNHRCQPPGNFGSTSMVYGMNLSFQYVIRQFIFI